MTNNVNLLTSTMKLFDLKLRCRRVAIRAVKSFVLRMALTEYANLSYVKSRAFLDRYALVRMYVYVKSHKSHICRCLRAPEKKKKTLVICIEWKFHRTINDEIRDN
jgi:hypothetical protein